MQRGSSPELEGPPVGETVSAANGTYSVTGLPAGTYALAFSPLPAAGNYAASYYPDVPDLPRARYVTVGNGQVVSNVDEHVYAPGSISGTVTDASGHPLQGVYVEAEIRESDGSFWLADLAHPTDGNGNYAIPGVPPGAWLVQFSDGANVTTFGFQLYERARDPANATPVLVLPGATISGINAQARPFCDLRPGCPATYLPSPRERGVVHVKVVIRWSWNGPSSQARAVSFGKLPPGGRLLFTCHGYGCPWQSTDSSVGRASDLIDELERDPYRAGDRIGITITAPGLLPERAEIQIRDGAIPVVRLLSTGRRRSRSRSRSTY